MKKKPPPPTRFLAVPDSQLDALERAARTDGYTSTAEFILDRVFPPIVPDPPPLSATLTNPGMRPWLCVPCKKSQLGPVCERCGAPATYPSTPALDGWACKCNQPHNSGKHCTRCGRAKPQEKK